MSRWLAVLITCWCVLPVFASGTDDLEGLVGRMLALRSELAAEKSAWKDHEKSLRDEIELLTRERTRLQQEADAFDEEISSGDEALIAEASRSEWLSQAVQDLLPVLSRTELLLRMWPSRIPPGLLGDAGRLFKSLPENETQARRWSAGERLQRIIACLSFVESLQQQIHFVKDVIDADDGERRFVDIVYLGLARGFAVSPDNQSAFVGTPGPAGWQWTAQPDWAPAIRQAVQVGNREQMAAFISLPLQVLDGAPTP